MHFSIQRILTIFICTIVIISIFIASIIFLNSEKKDVNLSIEEKLKIIQSEKKRVLDIVSENQKTAILNLANNQITTDAYINFRNEFTKDLDKIDSKRVTQIINEVQDRLSTSFFKQVNIANNGDVNQILADNPAGLCLEATYVYKLKQCSYGPNYDRFNKWFKDYISDNKFYDIFLIDPNTADIVYTAEKEADFGNNLKRKYFDNTGIQQVFNKAINSQSGDVVISDYAFYKPSLGAPAAFIATPVFKNGKLLFVLALQLNPDVLYRTISNNFKWKESGLGETGETLLIGVDGYIRNVSRFCKEQFASYKKFINDMNFPTESRELYERIQINSLIQDSRTYAFSEANKDNSGIARYKNYLGKEVIGIYEPVVFNGLKYILVTEIETSEAFKGYKNNINSTLIIGLLLALTIAVITLFLSKYISKPIVQLAKITQKFSENNEIDKNDRSIFKSFIKEINLLFKEFTSMQTKIVNNIQTINESKKLIEQSAKVLQKEVGQASEMQSLLLPSDNKFNFMSGFSRGAKDLSGDLYDFFEIAPNQIAFIIADISGKGIAASLLSAQVIAVYKSEIRRYPDLSSAVKVINQTIRDSNSKKFMTFVGGVYSKDTGNLSILNCGHLPAVIIDDKGNIERINNVTCPIGIIKYEDRDLIIKFINIKNRTMYLYTDGLLEASYIDRQFDDDSFGFEMFIKKLNLLPFNERTTFIEKELNSNKLKTKDDLTMLIIKG
jgi:serine phosphatase RsbU (regulator of sigma subunit)